jgi:ribA/ribD-fused uncharacterized protein
MRTIPTVLSTTGVPLVLFYGHDRNRYGDQAFFSNFFPASFTDPKDGVRYAHSEQYMMRQKALLFRDLEIAEQIMRTNVQAECKRLGRKVRNYDEEVWERVAEETVYQGVLLKFAQNPRLKEALLGTG